MTNGEKLCIDFPNMRYSISEHRVITTIGVAASFDLDWWNAEYKNPTTKNDLAHNLCDSCTNIGCEFQSGIVRTKCAFYMPPHLEPDNCGNYVIQEPTTKNDKVDCKHTDCKNCVNHKYCDYEPTKNDLSVSSGLDKNSKKTRNVSPIIDWNNCHTSEQLDSIATTKNDLAVDCISRQAIIDLMMQKWGENFSGDDAMQESIDAIRVMPPVTPQEPKWIPCSEKLPEYGEEVLTYSNVGGFIEIQSLKNSYGGYWENQRGDWSDLDEIIAWMPLPTPYEPQESEKV